MQNNKRKNANEKKIVKLKIGPKANKFSVEKNVDGGTCVCVCWIYAEFRKQYIDTKAKNHCRQRQRYQQ